MTTNETNIEGENNNPIKYNTKPRRKSLMINKDKEIDMNIDKDNDEMANKINIKARRKSMLNKKILIQLEENKYNNKKDATNISSKRNSFATNSISELRVQLNENKIPNAAAKNKRRKSAFIRPLFELNNFFTLKSQLISVSELVVQQESDIVEAIIGCQQPNNYHIYCRLPNGELSYLYKLREFSVCLMRIFCPVNCRGFSMKMKVVESHENKYDNNFNNCLIDINKNFKIPFLCLVRPEMKLYLTKDQSFLGTIEQSFSVFDPSFTIYNENEEEVKYIEADCCQCGFICRNNAIGKTEDAHFFIYNPENKTKPIGDICKKTESVFSIADSYSVTFPTKIPAEEKILLSIVAVLIDYQYYEKNNVK